MGVKLRLARHPNSELFLSYMLKFPLYLFIQNIDATYDLISEN